MNDNLLRLIMPTLKAEKNFGNSDRNLILPLILLIAADSGDTSLIFSLLYILL